MGHKHLHIAENEQGVHTKAESLIEKLDWGNKRGTEDVL
jgi:hypothetical protein